MLPRFFFDVADVDYIKDKWSKVEKYCNRQSVMGVTTNPGIWDKAGIKTFTDMQDRLVELSRLITKIRGDSNGIVYTQPPYSRMTTEEVGRFIELVRGECDGVTRIGCKLPPYVDILSNVDSWRKKYGMGFNVTGIADCSTALMAASYNVRHISIIPGRMEEAGIDAMAQINYVYHSLLGETEIITGSMRTVDCLRRSCLYGTVPTIGVRVWDKIFEEVGAENFNDIWPCSPIIGRMDFSPAVDKAMTDLSVAFFKQMDELGQGLYEGFREQL